MRPSGGSHFFIRGPLEMPVELQAGAKVGSPILSACGLPTIFNLSLLWPLQQLNGS